MGWRELEAIWDVERDRVVSDYCDVHVARPRALEWDYVRVSVAPARKAYDRPEMTGPYSRLDESGFEVTFNPDAGNIAVRGEFPKMSIADLPDPDAPFEVDSSELEIVEHVVRELGGSHFIIARSPVDGTFPWAAPLGWKHS